MQGIIFNLLSERVSELWGGPYWEELVGATAGLNNPVFVGPKSYPDEALGAILARITTDKRIATPDLLRSFGRWAFPKLAQAHPAFLRGRSSAKELLKSIETVIHTEVRKLYDDAYLPQIRWEEPDVRTLVLIYSSKRKLCWLAEGLVLGVGDFYREPLIVAQEICVHRGDTECRLIVTNDGAP